VTCESEPIDEPYRLEGPVLVLASPGTGKTYQLVRRIKWLVEERKVSPEHITVITFTNNAAHEMRERLSDTKEPELYLSPELQPLNIRTMHSLGLEIVVKSATGLGLRLPINCITDEEITKLLMGDAAQLVGERRSAANQTLECRKHGDCHPGEVTKCNICKKYKEILRACNAIDYDDQILLACECLEKRPDLLIRYQNTAQHLLVDEYQDINAAQLRLIRLLSQDSPQGVFVVGDDDQSIYSWRGGSPTYIRRFKEDFGENAKVVSLKCSRRCPPNILFGASAIVAEFDNERCKKTIKEFKNQSSIKIQIHNVPSDKYEAEFVRKLIQKTPHAKFLILIPTRKHGKLICEELRRAKIGYVVDQQLPGSGLLLLQALLQWLADSTDSIRLRQCLQAMIDSGHFNIPGPRVRKKDKINEREQALSSISHLWEDVLEKKVSLWKSLCTHAVKTPVLKDLCDSLTYLLTNNSISDVLSWVGDNLKLWPSLNALADEIRGWTEALTEKGGMGTSRIRIMTMQGAKGLQADVVCILGLEEGTLPREGAQNAELAEQARLLYVSMTRAKSELHLFHARKRSPAVSYQVPYRSGRPLDQSSFLKVIPNEFAERKFHRQ